MKSLFVFIQRLKQYFIKNRLIGTLFLLGGIVNTIAVLYCYGNLLPVMVNKHSAAPEYTSYVVFFQTNPVQLADIERISDSNLLKSYVLSDGRSVCSYDANYPMVKLSGSTEITDDNQVIVPSTAPVSVGDTLPYRGRDFTVIGSASSLGNMYFISYDAFMELCGTQGVKQIYLSAEERQDPYNDKIIQMINATFPYHDGIDGTAYALNHTEKAETERFLTLIVINAFFAVVSYIFLLHHLLDSMKNENVVCIFVGASKGRVASFVLRDAFSLCALSFLPGILIHYLLYSPLFTKLNLNASIQYTFGDYIFVYFLLLSLCLITAIPSICKVAATSPVAARRKVF